MFLFNFSLSFFSSQSIVLQALNFFSLPTRGLSLFESSNSFEVELTTSMLERRIANSILNIGPCIDENPQEVDFSCHVQTTRVYKWVLFQALAYVVYISGRYEFSLVCPFKKTIKNHEVKVHIQNMSFRFRERKKTL